MEEEEEERPSNLEFSLFFSFTNVFFSFFCIYVGDRVQQRLQEELLHRLREAGQGAAAGGMQIRLFLKKYGENYMNVYFVSYRSATSP